MNEETLFELAINAPPDAVPSLLDRYCAENPALRERIVKLLAAHSATSGAYDPLENHARGSKNASNTISIDRTPPDLTIGTMLGGKYKLIQVIGEGGMGSVYMAQQTEPVKRMVAVKVIKAGLDSKAVLARFEAERQALAIMDHPNIAKVFDAGTTDTGSPYFVMELVKGVPITKFCDEGKLTPRQRLELFLSVCDAIQHSHQKGIIHRDIKPSNVLIAMYDDKPVPKVIDFGVAKATERSMVDADLITGFGALVGTPEYMSPEQASLNNLDIDTRSDVYSLGVLLYELLSGHTPVDRKSLEKAAIFEILRIVRDVDAPLLSVKLSSIDTLPNVAANRRTEPKKLATQFRGELDWVLHKALEKDRTRRYPTAIGLARDIQRYLSNEIVEARPPSTLYFLQKFVKRNRGQVVAASFVLLSLLAGMAGTSWGLIRAEQRRAEAESARVDEAKQRGIAEANEAIAVEAKEEEAHQRLIADAEKLRAIEFQNKALDALRATTGEDVEKLIGEKLELTENEKAYLEAIAQRWQAFAKLEGSDQQTRSIAAEGHFRVADLWDELGRRDDALREFEQAEKIYQQLVQDFPSVTKHSQDYAKCCNNLGLVLKNLGRDVEAQVKIRNAMTIRETLLAEHPDVADYRFELASSHHNLGMMSAALGNNSEAAESYLRGLSIEEKLVEEFPDQQSFRSQIAKSHSNLGVLYSSTGKHQDALEQYRKAMEIREKLVADYPSERKNFVELASSYNNYGNLLGELGQNDKSVEQYRKAIAINEKMVKDYPGTPEFSKSLAKRYINLGVTLRSMGQILEAEELYRKALPIRERLATTYPMEPSFRLELAANHNNLGNLLREAGKLELALEQHRQALELREKLALDFSAVPDYRGKVATSFVNIGQILRRLEKTGEAEGYYRKAISILDKMAIEFPEVLSYREDLATTYNSLANILADLNKFDESLEQYSKAIAIGERLVLEHPDVPEFKVVLAGVYANRASKLMEMERPSESLVWFQKAIELLEPVHYSQAKSSKSERNLRYCYEKRSIALDQLQRSVEAESDWLKWIELNPGESKYRLLTQRAKRLIRDGKVAESIENVAKWSSRPDVDSELWYEFACVYAIAAIQVPEKKEEYLDRALELLKEAVKMGFDNAKRMIADSDLEVLRDRDSFRQLVQELELKSTEKNPSASESEERD